MKRPNWDPHDIWDGTTIKEDYETLWEYVEYLEDELDNLRCCVSGYRAQIEKAKAELRKAARP